MLIFLQRFCKSKFPINTFINLNETVVTQGHATICTEVMGSVPTRGSEIVNIFISSLWLQGIVLPLYTHASRIRRKMGNGSVLVGTEWPNTRYPGSLCLPSYILDTA